MSTDEISRIMDPPAAMLLLRPINHAGSENSRPREERPGRDEMNEGYLKDVLEMCLLS